jgi:hypothetical protein
MDALSFFTNPLGFASQYALTGKTPSQNFQGLFSGGLQGLLGGGGQQRPEVPLGPMAPAVDSRAGITSFQDAYNFGLQYGLGEEASNAAGITAASLVAQGMDPITAVTLATQNAAEMAAYNTPVVGSAMQGAAPQGMPGFGQLTPDFLTEYGTPIAQAPAETFGIGGGGQIESGYDFSGDFGGFGEASGATGGWV